MTIDSQATDGYTALTGAIALLETERVLFAIEGPRAERVVNGLVTNSLDGLSAGRAVYALALTAKGRPLAEMRVLPGPGYGETGPVWLDVPAAAADNLRDLLKRTVPPIFATISEPDLVRLTLAGPRATAWGRELLGLDGDFSEAPLTAVATELDVDTDLPPGVHVVVVNRESIEIPGIDVYVAPEAAGELRDALRRAVFEAGGAVASASDWDIARVERGLPVYGTDITPENLPQETGQTDRAVSFEKGCYTGQEVVARIHYRGKVNRRLAGLTALPGAGAKLESGASLFSGGRQVGVTTSVVDSPTHGRIGLGYVRTSIEPGTRLSVEAGAPPTIECSDLPFTNR